MSWRDAEQAIDRVLVRELGHVPRPWPGTLERLVRREAADAGMSPVEWATRVLGLRDRAAIDRLIAAATVPHTSFFRHPEHFDHLRLGLLRRMAIERGRPLRLWSAGCATGEEAWSLALTALELKVPVEILATDVSRENVEIARAGRYSGKRVTALPQARGACDWAAPSEARAIVTFEVASLTSGDPSGGRSGFDIVFCRNVLIYFDRAGQHDVVRRLAQRLDRRGFLVLSPTEAVMRLPELHADRSAPIGWFSREAIGAAEVHGPPTPLPPPSMARTLPPISSFTRLGGYVPASARADTPAPPPPSDALEQAARSIAAGDPTTAEGLLVELLDRDPEDAESWFLLGEALLHRGERAQAHAAFSRAARAEHVRRDAVEPDTLRRAARRRAEMIAG